MSEYVVTYLEQRRRAGWAVIGAGAVCAALTLGVVGLGLRWALAGALVAVPLAAATAASVGLYVHDLAHAAGVRSVMRAARHFGVAAATIEARRLALVWPQPDPVMDWLPGACPCCGSEREWRGDDFICTDTLCDLRGVPILLPTPEEAARYRAEARDEAAEAA